MKQSLFTKRRLFFSIFTCFLVFVAYDYVTYHSQYDAAMGVVSRLNGRSGSLLDWPFGRETIISFKRPLTDEELSELDVLNSLSGRHSIAVYFNCDLDNSQLHAASLALHKCRVYQDCNRLLKL